MRSKTHTEDKLYDLVILNGNLIDVKRGVIEKRNIGIVNGKISTVTESRVAGLREIDAEGYMVAPGFIDFHSHIDCNQYSAECLVKQGGTTTLGGERNIISDNIKRIEEEGFPVNQGFFISQSMALRSAVGVYDTYAAATKNEIRLMKELARRFMEYGVYGISFVLEFVPGTSKEEMIAMAEVAKEYDRPITVHLRKDGREALKYFDEIITVAEETGVSVQILQLMYMVGIGGAMSSALEIIDKARAKGLDITADSGVYDAYSACIGTNIFDQGWENEYKNTSVNDLLIVSGAYLGEYCTPDLFEYLRKEFPQTLVTAFVCDPEAITTALKKEYVYVSTNAADGPHYPGMGAPEVSGTYPRLIGKYVRRDGAISLVDAIRKITLLPALRYGMEEIGSIEEGKNADIVIFDFNTIIDKADFVGRGCPDAPPEGIKYVIVNGGVAVEDGILTKNNHGGKLIRKKCKK